LSLIPVNARKKPALKEWKPYQKNRASREQIEGWARRPYVAGFAVICGKVSDGLIILDFDVAGFYERWAALAGELVLVLPIQRTGGGGYQVGFRCGLPLKNDDLAWAPANNTMGREIAIETRAEGGYAVLPLSFCHLAEKRGKRHQHPYKVIRGDFANTPLITNEQAQTLIDIARSLDEMPVTKKQMQTAPLSPKSNGGAGGSGVIGAFNAFYEVGAILSRNGYQPRGNRYLAPDSTSGDPGVYIFEDTGRCYSHHTNDPLNDRHSHDPFSVFCLLEHGGDVRAAVQAAAAELGIERSQERPHDAPDEEAEYTRAEREAKQAEAHELPPDWRGPLPGAGKDSEGQGEKPSIADLVCDVSTFISIEFPPKATIIDPWLSESTINMIYGPRGIGKTMFALSILCSATTGKPIGPWNVNTPVSSLYLDGEMAPQDTQNRLNRFPSLKNSDRQPLIIYSDAQMNQYGLPRANLLDDDWRKMMKELLIANDIKL
jgi:hypothetical protein